MKEFKSCLEDIFNTITKSFYKIINGKNAKRKASRTSGIIVLISVLSLIFVVDNTDMFNTYQTFAMVIISLYFIAQAGSLWIFSRLEAAKLMEITFLKITALTVSTIGLLAIFETLARTDTMQMMEIFFMLLATALPLTVGKVLWDMSKNNEDKHINKKPKTIKKIDIPVSFEEDGDREETFQKAKKYREEMDEE